jgi:hypothetical protein
VCDQCGTSGQAELSPEDRKELYDRFFDEDPAIDAEG